MIFPIGDDNSDRIRTPFINYALIAINILVFIFLQSMGNDMVFTGAYSTVPLEIVTGQDVIQAAEYREGPMGNTYLRLPLGESPSPVYLTLITSMFMHGGIAHIFGNMLFLWVFGDNLENRLGHMRYLLFYLLTGVLASLCHVYATQYTNGDMRVPSLGASGAISGVMGGYVLLFPKRRVTILMLRWPMNVNAIFAIGIWIVFQIVMGMGLLGQGSEGGGVAYAAHIGGFVAGLLLIKLFAPKESVRQ